MRPEIEAKIKDLPLKERWVVIDGQTGECLSDPPSYYKPGFNVHSYGRTPEEDQAFRKAEGLALKELYIPQGQGNGQAFPDHYLYVVGDVGEGITINGRHATVFVEGKLGKNSSICVSKGIVSVASLDEGAYIGCSCPCLVDSVEDSKKSRNMTSRERHGSEGNDPVIVQVAKGRRKEVFSRAFGGGNERTNLLHDDTSPQLTHHLRLLNRARAFTDVYYPEYGFGSGVVGSFRQAGIKPASQRAMG